MATKLKTTEQDFFQIKENLKDYMRNQDDFADYDFDGSTLSHLLDILAYNTHYSALTANMSVNEMFLDSAVIRNNVVSHAKALGYTPQSMRSAQGTVNVKGDWDTSNGGTNTSTMLRGTVFTSSSGDFVTLTNYTAEPNTSIGPPGSIEFKDVKIYEGKLLKNSFTVGTEEQVYELPNKNIDTTTIRVRIRDNASVTTFTEYVLAKFLTDITNNSELYFLQEGRDEKFEIYFGDGVIGNKLVPGNIIDVEYVRTNGSSGNSIISVNLSTPVVHVSNTSVVLDEKTAGGGGVETMDSIKLNAPFNYGTQNRAVTSDDYNTLIRQIYPNIDTIAVWGGEDNDPAIYGKVFASIKPKTGLNLTTDAKLGIITTLKSYKVMSILPEVVDPEYIYLILDIVFKYDSGITLLTEKELSTLVLNVVNKYNDEELLSFNKMFRHSAFSTRIDGADPAIVSSTTRVKVKKYLIPTLDTVTRYEIPFYNTIYHPHSGHLPDAYGVIQSNGFYMFGNTTQVYYIQDDGAGVMILFHKEAGSTTAIIDNGVFGTVDYLFGKIIIPELNLSGFTGLDDKLSFTVELDSNDVVPVRNQIIQIGSSTITPSEDSVSSGTYSGNINYIATPSRT